MKVLAIETSCDETAVTVIEAQEDHVSVLSNIVSSQIELHAQYGGVVPALAAREHAANIQHVFETALKTAGITDPERDIALLVVTRGPGLGPALLVGITFARTLAWKWNKPLVGVDHMDGHIHSNWLLPGDTTPDNSWFPALNVVVSGGHTELVLMRDHGQYEIIGETQDDAIGEAFDKIARMLDLGYPGGPKVSKLAQEGNPTAYDLPRPMLHSLNLDFSYSGLKTAVLYLIQDLTNKGERALTDQEKADIAASFQHVAVDVLIQKTKKASHQYDVKSILLSGGVSANKLLRERLATLSNELGLPYRQPAMAYTGDNAAMIAAAGYFRYLKGDPTSPSGEAASPQDDSTSSLTKLNQKETDPFHWKSVSMDANLRL